MADNTADGQSRRSNEARESARGLFDAARVTPGAVMDAVGGGAGLVRIVGGAAARAAAFVAKGAYETARDIAQDLSSGEVGVTEVIDTRVEQARSTAAKALGVGGDGHVEAPRRRTKRGTSLAEVRARGVGLIEASWDPKRQPRDDHPAYARIMDELTPDEARILRFLYVAGPQPAIDVRTKGFRTGSVRVLAGVNMIADVAGCTWPDRNRQYLNNLNRLGLVRFSLEQLEDIRRYMLLEVKRETKEAMDRAGGFAKCKTIYRSIYLSSMGKDFTYLCLPTDDYTAGGWDKPVII